MESIYNDLCRLCLQNGNILLPMFDKNTNNIEEKITYCTIIEIMEGNGFPENICVQCINNITQYYEFKKLCQNSDKILREIQDPFMKLINIKNNPYSEQAIQDKQILPRLFQKIFGRYCHSGNILKRVASFMKDLKINFQGTTESCNQPSNTINYENKEHIPAIESEPFTGFCLPTSLNLPVTPNNNHGSVDDTKEMSSTSVTKNIQIRPKTRGRYKALSNNSKSMKTRILQNKSKSEKCDSLYSCKYCKDIFESHGSLQRHRKTMHSHRYTCLYCNKTFRSLNDRKQHMESHRPESELVHCDICNKSCRSFKALRAHKLIHTGALKAKCQICYRLFSSPANVRRHMMIHLNQRPHMCHYCGASFNQAGTRDAHIMVKHSPEKVHRCKLCTMRFETTDLLQKHVLRHDLQTDETLKKLDDKKAPKCIANEKVTDFDIPTPTCKECNKSFTTRANLKNHVNWHSKPFLCIICGKGFATKHILKNHERTHTGERPFPCPFCERAFTMKVLLKSHLRTHSDNVKTFLCPYCPKRFALQSTLKTHTYTHTGERPYKCTICDKTFNQNAHLRTHLFTHTGEKKHVCEICNKAFALKEGLRYHTMTHTGETPFTCGECGRGFYIQYKLKVHMSKSHNMQSTEIK